MCGAVGLLGQVRRCAFCVSTHGCELVCVLGMCPHVHVPRAQALGKETSVGCMQVRWHAHLRGRTVFNLSQTRWPLLFSYLPLLNPPPPPQFPQTARDSPAPATPTPVSHPHWCISVESLSPREALAREGP